MTGDQVKLKMKTIGLVLDFFNPGILAGAQSYAKENNLLLDARWSVRGDWTPLDPGWDGLIYGVTDHPALAKRLKKWKLPKVSLIKENKEDYRVDPDYRKCGDLAVDANMITKGDHILNIIASSREIDHEFSQGVTKKANQLGVPNTTVLATSHKISEILLTLVAKIQSLPYHLSIYLPHAGLAYGLQKELLALGVRIPEDVSMVVINKDVQQTHNLAPVPLTTVEIDEWHRGFVAAEMLHHILQKKKLRQKHIRIPPKGVTHRASTGFNQAPDLIVAKALSFVRQNYIKPINVTDVVSATGVSRRLVETRFRNVLNRGIHEELSRLRIEEAKRLIMNKDTSITAIAEGCGFSSVHYFSAAFKKETGLSPKQYQKQKNST